jgi:hypothetical protein
MCLGLRLYFALIIDQNAYEKARGDRGVYRRACAGGA